MLGTSRQTRRAERENSYQPRILRRPDTVGDRYGVVMPRLLVVHHSPTPNLRAILDAVVAGARHEDIEDVDVVLREALSTTVDDVLAADGYVIGTSANIGYISGAVKHFCAA